MSGSQQHNSFSISPRAFVLVLTLVVVGLWFFQAWFGLPQPSQPEVVLTEFCAHNGTGLRDQDGDHSDWIELYNPSTNAVNLAGWYLTDNLHALTKWRFPSFTLAPGGYGIVFASGKDRTNPVAPLHTNFKLNEQGDYLALVRPDGRTVARDFFPKYPPQRRDVSYGLPAGVLNPVANFQAAAQQHRFFVTPTPGAPNGEGLLGLTGPVEFNRPSGLLEIPFTLTLSAHPPGATIYYTTDGSSPSAQHGTAYTRPIRVAATTVIRAMAERPPFAPSEAVARTFVFRKDLQTQQGTNFPATWGVREGWTVPAYYNMAAEVAASTNYQKRLWQGLEAIPWVSIVTDLSNLFDPETGIYCHPMTNGYAWERPVALEFFNPDGSAAVQVNCGLRIQGGWNRRPEESPKHSLRLLFKKEYGTPKLRLPLFGTNGAVEFDTLILRAGNNNSWLHWNFEERRRADYARDEWMRQTFQAMGHPSARGRFVHVFLNGLYWGVYDLCERPSGPFMAAIEGGDRADYDTRNSDKILSGDKLVWDKMLALANAGLRERTNYEQFQQYLDLPEFTDYLILNFYGANGDWDRASNWYAARRRNPPGKYQFLVWDGERTLEGINDNTMDFDDDESPPRLFHKLAENADFRMFFADRVQRVLLGAGPLSAAPATDRYAALAKILETPLVAESARWGNYRRDIHQYKVGPYEFYQVDRHWQPEIKRLLGEYFAQRPAALLKIFRERGLYPRMEPPVATRNGGEIRLKAAEGEVLYTLNGADPRLMGGEPSPEAKAGTQAITIPAGTQLKARASVIVDSKREWSALVEY